MSKPQCHERHTTPTTHAAVAIAMKPTLTANCKNVTIMQLLNQTVCTRPAEALPALSM